MKQLLAIDRHLLKWMYQRPFSHNLLIRLLIFVGDAPFWMLTLLICAIAGEFGLMSFEHAAILLIAGLALGNAIFTPLKIKAGRLRPYADSDLQQRLAITIENRDPRHGSKERESFPSGHALWTTLSVCLIGHALGWPAWLALGWLMPAMVLLRPYLGVHYPSDTLAGFGLGVLLAAVVCYAEPSLLAFVTYLKQLAGSGYAYAYWVFLTGYLYIGIRSWQRRV